MQRQPLRVGGLQHVSLMFTALLCCPPCGRAAWNAYTAELVHKSKQRAIECIE